MKKQPTVCSSSFRATWNALRERNVADRQIAGATGLARDQVDDVDRRFPVEQWNLFLHTAVALSGEPAFALHLGERVVPEDMSVVAHVAFNSAYLDEAVRHYARFAKLANEAEQVTLSEKGTEVSLAQATVPACYAERLSVERTFSLGICRIRRFTERDIDPLRVCFQHAAPAYLDEYERIFRCPIRFGAKSNTIVMDRDLLHVHIPHRSSQIHNALLQHAESLLGEMAQGQLFRERVQRLILQNLHRGEVDIGWVAGQLAMSRYTLYRRLREEGVKFQDLLDETRRELALKYLGSPEYSVNDVAFLLGFSETSAFSRAFRRWTGESPATFRRGRPG